MIRTIKHRGLRELYESGNGQYVDPRHVRKLRNILAVLDESPSPRYVTLQGLRPHALSGPMRGHYSVWVSGNWRVTFRFEDGDVHDVDYIDYH